MELNKSKIKSIKKVGKRRVYDLSVRKNHNFFLSNSILSHNCLDTQSPCLDENTKIMIFGKEDNDIYNIEIKNLPDVFYVKSYNFKEKKFEKKVGIKWEVGEKDCYEIMLEDESKVISTGDHRFFEVGGNQVFAKDLKEGCAISKEEEYEKILSIKKIGKRKVYDISVEGNQNFLLSNGILSHNSETKGIVSGQQDLTILGRLPSERDRQEATGQLYKDGLMKKKEVTRIGTLESGQFIVCPTGRKAYEEYFLLPKTRFWEEGNSNFYTQIWKNEVDKWTSFKDEVDEIKTDFELELEEIKEEKERKKREQQMKKEEERRKKEEERRKERERKKKEEQKKKEQEKKKKVETKEEELQRKIRERQEALEKLQTSDSSEKEYKSEKSQKSEKSENIKTGDSFENKGDNKKQDENEDKEELNNKKLDNDLDIGFDF